MKLDEFMSEINTGVFTFAKNMIHIENDKDKTPQEWMETFLRWMEWKTDMHDQYWKED